MTSHCTGLTNSILLAPQRIRFAIGNFARELSTICGSRSCIGFAGSVCEKQILPFSSDNSSSSALFFFAKPSNAFVGLPSSL